MPLFSNPTTLRQATYYCGGELHDSFEIENEYPPNHQNSKMSKAIDLPSVICLNHTKLMNFLKIQKYKLIKFIAALGSMTVIVNCVVMLYLPHSRYTLCLNSFFSDKSLPEKNDIHEVDTNLNGTKDNVNVAVDKNTSSDADAASFIQLYHYGFGVGFPQGGYNPSFPGYVPGTAAPFHQSPNYYTGVPASPYYQGQNNYYSPPIQPQSQGQGVPYSSQYQPLLASYKSFQTDGYAIGNNLNPGTGIFGPNQMSSFQFTREMAPHSGYQQNFATHPNQDYEYLYKKWAYELKAIPKDNSVSIAVETGNSNTIFTSNRNAGSDIPENGYKFPFKSSGVWLEFVKRYNFDACDLNDEHRTQKLALPKLDELEEKYDIKRDLHGDSCKSKRTEVRHVLMNSLRSVGRNKVSSMLNDQIRQGLFLLKKGITLNDLKKAVSQNRLTLWHTNRGQSKDKLDSLMEFVSGTTKKRGTNTHSDIYFAPYSRDLSKYDDFLLISGFGIQQKYSGREVYDINIPRFSWLPCNCLTCCFGTLHLVFRLTLVISADQNKMHIGYNINYPNSLWPMGTGKVNLITEFLVQNRNAMEKLSNNPTDIELRNDPEYLQRIFNAQNTGLFEPNGNLKEGLVGIKMEPVYYLNGRFGEYSITKETNKELFERIEEYLYEDDEGNEFFNECIQNEHERIKEFYKEKFGTDMNLEFPQHLGQ